uniref:single-stranded DNA-binding protein n=1 Tax=Fibrobacter sp. TaxID=35828 RepID=UPI003863FFE9
MAYLNKVMLIGNLGKDPEIRVSPTTGSKQVIFSIATSRRYRDNNGEQKEQTDWHNIIGWGKIADIVEQLG